MWKKIALGVVAAVAAAVYVGYSSNVAPPAAAISAEEAAKGDKPLVVKLHAQWCGVCLMTRDVWARIEAEYAGRVHLVVFDFTDDARTEAAKKEAARLGLGKFFESYDGVTGAVAVVRGTDKEVAAEIAGVRDYGEYKAAIEAALQK